jgi:hypothetical protein
MDLRETACIGAARPHGALRHLRVPLPRPALPRALSRSRTTGGGPGRPPLWRTLEESCKGLGSVTLHKINTLHTLESPGRSFGAAQVAQEDVCWGAICQASFWC